MSAEHVIGIVGGTGPDAAIHLQQKLSDYMKLSLGAIYDQHHLRVIVDNDPKIPDRSACMLGKNQEAVRHYHKKISELSELGASIILLPCNTIHANYSELQLLARCEIVNIINATIDYLFLSNTAHQPVGVIATYLTVQKKLYHDVLRRKKVLCIEPDEYYQCYINQAIYGIKAGFKDFVSLSSKERDKLVAVYKNAIETTLPKRFSDKYEILPYSPYYLLSMAVENLYEKGVKHIILGCSELPLIDFLNMNSKVKFVSCLEALAVSAINKVCALRNATIYE